jgi:hypothetical protein
MSLRMKFLNPEEGFTGGVTPHQVVVTVVICAGSTISSLFSKEQPPQCPPHFKVIDVAPVHSAGMFMASPPTPGLVAVLES